MNCRRRSRPNSEEIIGMTSMMDLIFLLLIFFLVTTTFKQEEVDHLVNLPADSRNPALTKAAENLITINIRKDGSYVVLGKQVTEEDVSKWMGEEVAKKPDIKVLIRSDQDAKHLYLANMLSICNHVGVPRANIALKTEK
jgi:biopolymer transport protein ExbD